MRCRVIFRAVLVPLLSVFLAAAPAAAATWRVLADGSGDFATIQQALTAAAPGDDIIVGDGTHDGNGLDFLGKAVVLRSENGPAACTIARPWATDSVFRIVSGEGRGTVIDGFTIIGGSAANGGGIRIVEASPTIVNNVITGNTADFGGGIHVSGTASNPFIVNNLIEDNYAFDEGGGLYKAYGAVFMRNNTVAYNQAPVASGMRFQGGTVDIAENIFWGNFNGTQLSGAINGTFSYNLVAGWVGPGTSFDGNPAFADGPDGGYYLGAASDAIDAGGLDATAACYTGGGVTVCMSGLTTSTGQAYDTGAVDVGFHHRRVPAVFNVPGAYPNLQSAVDATISGDTVVLAAGVYSGPGNRDVVIDGKSITVRGPAPGQGEAFIDCQGSPAQPRRAFRIQNVHSGVEIADLTISGGYATYGGGILISNASPVIRRCIFDSNQAQSSGAIHVPLGARAVIEDCVFQANEASDSGGALAVQTDQLEIRRCVFRSNWANWAAGALYFNNGSAIIEECLFLQNSSSNWGGAVHVNNAYSEPLFTACTFQDNRAPQGGAFYLRNGAMATVVRSIIAGGTQGAATHCITGGFVSLICSDVWGNAGGDYTGCLAGLNGFSGNISVDPLFCDPAALDFALEAGSPCLAACGTMGYKGAGCTVSDVPAGPPAAGGDRLLQNAPNPFNPSTRIACELAAPGRIDLAVFDLAGRRVRTLAAGEFPAGRHDFVWDGRGGDGQQAASGVYACRLRSAGGDRTIRLVLLK